MFTIIFNTVGILGDFLVLIAYTLLQFKKLRAETFWYSFLNLIGAAFILFSLCFSWNLPAAIIEITWIFISFYGLIQAWRNKGTKFG